MPDEQEPKEKKIIIDEDWKSQIEAEREAVRKEEEAKKSAAPEPSPEADRPLPPPNLTYLASSLYLQGMIALGLLPNPVSDNPEVQINLAKHSIDMLQVLYEKTEGNRSAEETEELDTMLHELRMAYVSVQQGKDKGNDEGGMMKEE